MDSMAGHCCRREANLKICYGSLFGQGFPALRRSGPNDHTQREARSWLS